ncbi:MAG: hypothetical protein MJ123_01020 [Lachnospiraceae bacterium]|nr:hypothetical protein [Lachnospiraceae bacterium]
MESKYNIIKEGRGIFVDIKNKYCLNENDYIILFPDDMDELSNMVIDNIEVLKRKKYVKRFFFVCCDQTNLHVEKRNDTIWICCSQKELDALMAYYTLVDFFSNIIVASYDMPFGSKGIIGKNGISLRDYVVDVLFV